MTTDQYTLARIAASKNGDKQAFGELYDEFVERIYRFVYYKIGHKETAEDITSQIFFKVLKHISRFDEEKGTFSSWLYKIARNTVIDHYRQHKKNVNIDDFWNLSTDERLEEDINSVLNKEKILEYLSHLSADQKSIIILRTWQGMSHSEIASVLDKSEESCRMAYSRGLKKLREYIPADMLLVFLLGILNMFL